FLARPLPSLVFFRILRVPVMRLRNQQVNQAFVDFLLGLGFYQRSLLLADHADGDFSEIPDHAFDVAPMLADFRILGRLDLQDWRANELCQPAGDFSFSHAGRPDHDDVLGRHIFLQFRRKLLPPPTIPDRDRDGALGRVLTYDISIQLLNNLARGQ